MRQAPASCVSSSGAMRGPARWIGVTAVCSAFTRLATPDGVNPGGTIVTGTTTTFNAGVVKFREGLSENSRCFHNLLRGEDELLIEPGELPRGI